MKKENLYLDTSVISAYFDERAEERQSSTAITSFHGISYLVSWNFEHLVKVKTRKGVNSVNMSEGFREIEIVSPPEL